jgi:hypothetical protein
MRIKVLSSDVRESEQKIYFCIGSFQSPMFEYVYVWDRKNGKCLAVWHVMAAGMPNEEMPSNTKGPVAETEIDAHVKGLLQK